MKDNPLLSAVDNEVKKNNPWRPILLYILIGFIWALYSDRILEYYVTDYDLYTQMHIYKSWFDVLLTAGLMYLLVRFDNRRLHLMNEEIMSKNMELVAFAEQTLAMENELEDKVEQLDKMVYEDSLTGLRNRLVFEQDLDTYIRRKVEFALYYIDVDQFKTLNELHGHYYGDLFLVQFARMLDAKFDKLQLYRWGGDEFVIIDPINKGQNLIDAANAILELTHRTWQLEEFEFHTSTSIGVIECPKHGSDVNTVFKNLEIALYRAKEKGRSRCEFFDPSLLQALEKRSQIESAINEALTNDGFFMHYQPIYGLHNKEIHLLEVLLRFNETRKLNTHIGEVISVAEQTGQIHRIDEWVIKEVFSKLKAQQKSMPDLRIAINISSQTFTSVGFIPYLMEMIEQYSIDPKYIEFEITEHTIVNNIEDSYTIMKKIKSLGFMIALDDFGTRYSSLNYLSRLPFDVLKIDKSYVDNMLNEGKDHVIVKQIIALAKEIGLETIAEGIEMQEQEKALFDINCDYGQGYYFSRPETFDRILEKFAN